MARNKRVTDLHSGYYFIFIFLFFSFSFLFSLLVFGTESGAGVLSGNVILDLFIPGGFLQISCYWGWPKMRRAYPPFVF